MRAALVVVVVLGAGAGGGAGEESTLAGVTSGGRRLSQRQIAATIQTPHQRACVYVCVMKTWSGESVPQFNLPRPSSIPPPGCWLRELKVVPRPPRRSD